MIGNCVFVFMCFSGVAMEETVDIEQLPEAIPRGLFKPVNLPSGQDPTYIMFDLETTDLSKTIFVLFFIF